MTASEKPSSYVSFNSSSTEYNEVFIFIFFYSFHHWNGVHYIDLRSELFTQFWDEIRVLKASSIENKQNICYKSIDTLLNGKIWIKYFGLSEFIGTFMSHFSNSKIIVCILCEFTNNENRFDGIFIKSCFEWF